jgi:hypothetical protein|tara:strand:+ start:246 stop:515 length:270 start_codon:yes stop_codon:yes gene_type:complete
MDGRKNNSGTIGNKGGRPKKADELKLIEKLDNLIDNDEVIKTLGKQILKGDSRAMSLYFGYRYGKPKESVDITSTDGFNINFKDIIKFK